MSATTQLPNDLKAQRDAFHEELKAMSITPLWLNLATAAQNEPKVDAVPHIWRWRDIKPMMLRGGDLISPQEAERRVLMLINPSFEAKSARTVGMIFGGIQFLMPGEIELRREKDRREKGVEVPQETWRQINELAARLGADLSEFADR